MKLTSTLSFRRRAIAAGFGLTAWLTALGASGAAPSPEEPTPEGIAAASSAPVTSNPGAGPAAGRDDPATYLPSLDGPIGLYRMSSAEVGPRHHLRFALHGQYFRSRDFLVGGDTDTQLAGALTFGFTPIRALELFGGLFTASNRNQRTSEPGRTDPEVIRSHGDLVVGAKYAAPIGAASMLGFETGLRFLASASSLAFATSSTSLWFGPMATVDLRPLMGAPLRFHVNANFYVDNSKNVYDLNGTTLQSDQAAKFAYGVAESRLRLAAGLDAPLEKLTGPVPLRPFAEYHAELITAAADPAFAGLMPSNGGRDRQWLTFGLRARIYGGATLDVGSDVRLRTNGPEYGPPLPPYDVVFGASYPLDVDAFTRPVIVTRTIDRPIPPPPPSEGRIAGVAKDKEGKAIARAVVVVAGRAHGGVITDADGTFEIPSLPPGPANLEISAADYDSEKLTTSVTAGDVAKVAVVLTAKVRTGSVRGKTTDGLGHAVEATLRFSGAQSYETRTDSGGAFAAALLPGPYRVVAEAPGLPSNEGQFEVAAGSDREVDLTLRPLSPDLTVTADQIGLRAPIRFRSGAPRLTPEWQAELDGVAAFLQDRPELRLRIVAHWDTDAAGKSKALTAGQAMVVRDYLAKKGIADSRLEAVGMGADQPMVPNVSPAYKAKNRRVELQTLR
jgi:outer membrane protein OmpA-like peptidoglycan-associated protein